MSVRSLTLSVCLVAATAALPTLSVAGTRTAGTDVRSEAFGILKDFHGKSIDLESQATELQSISHDQYVSWQTHVVTLNALKDDINDMGRELARLEQVRESASPLERKAIDEAAPLLKSIADNTTAAVKFLNANQDELWEKAYLKYVDDIAAESMQLTGSVGKILKLAKVHTREEQLEKATGIEAGSF